MGDCSIIQTTAWRGLHNVKKTTAGKTSDVEIFGAGRSIETNVRRVRKSLFGGHKTS
jgi:hypothetical protein